MPLVPLKLPPGLRSTGTVYQAKERWHAGNLVRFFQDTIQPVGGWTERTLTGDTMAGVPRAMISYRLNDDTQVLVVGTTAGVYAIIDDVVYDITPFVLVEDTLQAMTDDPTRLWQFDVFGAYLVAVDLKAPNTGGAMYYWTGNTASVLQFLDPFVGTVPINPLSVVGTPERYLVALGAVYTDSGWTATGQVPKSRVVTWATQEGGFTGTEWVPASTNTAGDFTLTTDGALVCGRRSRGSTLLWTTTDLWGMTYIGGTFVYRFDQLGNKCGIIGPNAVVVSDTGAYWMGDNGFYLHDGFVKPIVCDVHDFVFQNINRTYAYKVWALENPTFGEVTWFYPAGNATEITSYVTFNYRENHWVTGSLVRTCGIASQPGVHVYPVMADADGAVFDHEDGWDRGDEGAPYLESGPLEIGEGDQLMSLQRIIPDDKTVGDVALTVFASPDPDTSEDVHGPYPLEEQTALRVKARQIRIRLDEQVETGWRVGTIRLQAKPSGRR